MHICTYMYLLLHVHIYIYVNICGAYALQSPQWRCPDLAESVRKYALPSHICPLTSSPVGPFVDTKEPSRLDWVVRKEAIAEEDA